MLTFRTTWREPVGALQNGAGTDISLSEKQIINVLAWPGSPLSSNTQRLSGLTFCTSDVAPVIDFPQAFQHDSRVLCF